MTIIDEVIETIDCEIASHNPERGGLLFGPIGRDLITLFVPDKTATTTSVTYQISSDMCDRAPTIERETQLEYKGIVHSHPGLFDSPSGGDEYSAANALSMNPHLPKFFMPIITKQIPESTLSHESPMPHGKLSSYCAYRTRKTQLGSTVHVKTESVRIMPLKSHLRGLCKHLSCSGLIASMTESGTPVFQENIFQLAYVVTLEGADLIVLAGEDYPHFSPHLLFTTKDGSTECPPLLWDVSKAPETRLLNAILTIPQINNLLKITTPINRPCALIALA